MVEHGGENLFRQAEKANIDSAAPLAVKIRPSKLEDFVGQKHILGEGKLLTRMLIAGKLSSLLFYGPPGVGKTTLAKIVAGYTKAMFVSLNAANATVKDIRAVTSAAKDRLAVKKRRTVLFLDEIHRFSKSQQDVLLDDVENGIIILIGATTENPFFSINSPLISRSTMFKFEPLNVTDIMQLLEKAIADKINGFGNLNIKADKEALEHLATVCDGDVRKAIGALEIGVLSQVVGEDNKNREIVFDMAVAVESIQRKSIYYDSGDSHYDLASALQKSMRGSDPDATVYWLAQMIAGGEDVRFIARRIAVCAAEDVGNADPTATILAAAAIQIAEFVGLPEAQLPLAQAAIYIACAPKSNACTLAIHNAMKDVQEKSTIRVPKHLKDSHYSGAKKMGLGEDYKYPHDFSGGFVVQQYLPTEDKRRYYQPKESGYEKNIQRYLQKLQILIQNSVADDKK